MINCFKDIIKKDWGYVICGEGVNNLKPIMMCADGELENLSTILKGYNALFTSETGTMQLPVFVQSNLSNEELRRILSCSKIFFHAKGYGKNQKSEPQEFEHFGMATAEAMAQGCVPVVFNGGGQKEIVENGVSGFLFDDKEQAITYLNKLTNDEKLIESMSKEAIKAAKRFDTKIFQSRIIKIVGELTNESK
jgi:glycosyltransferase involved in cell wall biosynthesis